MQKTSIQKNLIKPVSLSLALMLGSTFITSNSFAEDQIGTPIPNGQTDAIEGNDEPPKTITCKVEESDAEGAYCHAEDDTCRSFRGYIYFQTSPQQCEERGGKIIGLFDI